MNQKAPLADIRPDPDQPRSLLPPDLVGLFTNGLMSPQAIMTEWQKSPNSALAGIMTLADSIAQHGQINPISVQPSRSLPGIEYLIVTGERRWWAHVLLLTQGRLIIEGDTRSPADQIKISLVTSGVSIRAHQLIENVVREDLDAVEKAHGMWALRYELSGKNFCEILPTSGQEKYLVGWGEVERSLGVSSRYRQYVIGVLKLTPDALRLVAEHGLSESTIRPITQKLHKYPDLQIKALMQLVDWQQSEDKHSLIKEVKEMVEGLVAEIPEVGTTPRPSLLPLGFPAKKSNGVPLARAHAVNPAAPAPQAAPIPAPKPVTRVAPVPVMAPQTNTPQVTTAAQKPLTSTPQALRIRPQQMSTVEHDLQQACASLITALDQIDLGSGQIQHLKEDLLICKMKIDHILSIA